MSEVSHRGALQGQGLRCTPARLRVLALLSASARHLSVPEACSRLGQAGKRLHATTVYRTLETFTAVGPGPTPGGAGHCVYGP
ncbi:transcriptional repressor [Streptomyces nigra]|uniref:transcriptional repressor n=1 Tax=Streptomyces nigra TaxID=1827580 RepID=UPI0037FA4BE0